MTHRNIQEEFQQLALLAEKLNGTGKYDIDKAILGLKHMFNGNYFYYDYLVGNDPTNDPGKVFYDLKVNPEIHQLVYVQLGAGYAKELRGPHWCYVVRVTGQKMTVIPATSVKEWSGPARAPYELDIVEEDGVVGRLHFDDALSIDKLRVDERKGYRQVLTPHEEVAAAYRNFLGREP